MVNKNLRHNRQHRNQWRQLHDVTCALTAQNQLEEYSSFFSSMLSPHDYVFAIDFLHLRSGTVYGACVVATH